MAKKNKRATPSAPVVKTPPQNVPSSTPITPWSKKISTASALLAGLLRCSAYVFVLFEIKKDKLEKKNRKD